MRSLVQKQLGACFELAKADADTAWILVGGLERSSCTGPLTRSCCLLQAEQGVMPRREDAGFAHEPPIADAARNALRREYFAVGAVPGMYL